ncbi:MAG: Holliday junction branch migration DNA helicase RuvB [Methanosarcinales archaeon]
MKERIIGSDKKEDDIKEEEIRPSSLNTFIGQEKIKKQLRIFIDAAKQRKESLDHVLFHGPHGLGKTTLANIIAKEMGVKIVTTSGPVIEKAGNIASIITKLSNGTVLFIDEIHRLNKAAEETLYSAMEDYELDIMIGKGASAKSVRIKIPKFTLVGATTRAGLLSSPLKNRFGIVNRLEFYYSEDLQKIIERASNILNIQIDEEGSYEIARRSRGTPRVALRLLRRTRDYAQVKGNDFINKEIADKALNLLEIDEKGLDSMDRRILTTILEKFNGGPVGIDTIAAAIGEEADTIEDVYEPYLIQIGFINRFHRGRIATELAHRHIKKCKKLGYL